MYIASPIMPNGRASNFGFCFDKRTQRTCTHPTTPKWTGLDTRFRLKQNAPVLDDQLAPNQYIDQIRASHSDHEHLTPEVLNDTNNFKFFWAIFPGHIAEIRIHSPFIRFLCTYVEWAFAANSQDPRNVSEGSNILMSKHTYEQLITFTICQSIV